MPTQPEDIVNEALGEIGAAEIGDLYDGTPAGTRALRVYDTTLRELHAVALWNFARRQLQLNLLRDATEIYMPKDPSGMMPWRYIYEWPTDCVHMRYILGAGTTAMDTETGLPTPGLTYCLRVPPIPFIVSDYPHPNYDSIWSAIEGHSPESTRVIMTHELGANAVYTGLVQYPDAWPALFRRALVTTLSARLAMSVVPDKKLAAQLRDANRAIAKEALIEARVQDGNEGWTRVDLYDPDWITIRNGSRYGGPGGYY